jgi:uncharacterized caspase-like protein
MVIRSAFCLLFLVLVHSGAFAEKRIALAIGNSAYQHTSKLANPKNDATDMVTALRRLGFDLIIEGFDLDKANFDRKVRDFATALQGSDIGVFFYAGHGLQVAGQNYLVPVDATAETPSALDFEMVRLDLIQRTMERETKTNVLFLDACRDNPLARNLARALGTRSMEIGRGLASVEAGSGTLVSFSTQPGNVALDGEGKHSPFAGSLLRRIATPGEDLSSILISVRNDVMRETNRRQVPWEHSALTERLYFTAPVSVLSADQQYEMALWTSVKDSDDPKVLRTYLERYPTGIFAPLAQTLIEKAKRVEAQRMEESHRAAEERQRDAEHKAATEKRLAAEAEVIHRAEEQRKVTAAVEAQRKIEEQKQQAAEDKRSNEKHKPVKSTERSGQTASPNSSLGSREGWMTRQGYKSCRQVYVTCKYTDRDRNGNCDSRYAACKNTGCWDASRSGRACGLTKS